MKSPESPLELAINFEVEGREYFLKAAEKVKHPLGKSMFEALARDESRHIQAIKRIKASLKEGNEWPDEQLPEKSGAMKSIFKDAKQNMDKDVKPDEDDLEVIKQALALELKGHKFYRELAEKESDPKAIKFYELLANEEKGHYTLLQNTEEYLKNPEDWFCKEEGSIFEG